MFRRWIGRLILWFLKDELDSVKREMQNTISQQTHVAVDKLRDQVASLAAMDVAYQEMGHVVLILRVGDRDRGRDIVKIIDVPKVWTMRDYMQFADELDQRFGVRRRAMDVPMGVNLREFRQGLTNKW